MDFTLKTSLISSASIAVITGIWYKEKVIEELLNKHNSLSSKIENSWQNSEDNVVEHLNLLPIPKSTKFLMINLVQPIGRQLKNWLEFHRYLDITENDLADVLVWNTPGVINTKQTAMKLIKKNILCPLHRFRVACVNCVETEIYSLWPQVRYHFFDSNDSGVSLMDTIEVMFWVCYLEDTMGELIKLIEHEEETDFMGFAFWAAVENNNDVAAKYFSTKVESKNLCRMSKNSLNFTVMKRLNCNPSLLVFLLSNVSKSDQDELFHSQPENILAQFLTWPLQVFFVELAKKLLNSLTTIGYYNVLEKIIRKVSENHWGHSYFEIFTGFWEMAPLRHKSYVIYKCIKATFLSIIFSLKKTDDVIGFLLKEMNDEERLKVLLEFNGMLIIDYLVSKERRESLTMFINGCVSAKEDVIKLRKLYFEHAKRGSYLNITRDHLHLFTEVLENISVSRLQ